LGLTDDLGSGPIGVDTSVFIYLIEEHPRFLPMVWPMFELADAGSRQLVTSALTLLEVLVVPYRSGDAQLAERYERTLSQSRGLTLVSVTRNQLRAAAQLRALTGMRTPDALQVAAAMAGGCRTFVTNDRRLPEVPGLRVLQISDY
jgi:predicted nucleic acid-binding protein